ncbi:hypothetical protein PPL_00151 [Heterostelium album PN500]|uniref:Uncharacterized protein n=1 Tax=Heterostelium pallidum (strain ATCC 26659 / Pp 5 / PN500) TaxID=670386 RepID=D3AVN6_HETP5|nr:hypothetical protein PPL_00151 [Heterostelium album PN500]EFA86359.1 hypothetical protein PPL_00151 [Heterostelium album PN500]|eukprot:XP_020438464.1 hypothetical protein PPL_00151 [Heterostelium album PN500]
MVFGVTDSLAYAFRSYVLMFILASIGVFTVYNMRVNVQDKITSAPLLDSFIFGYTPEEAMKVLNKMSSYELSIYQSFYTNGYDIVLPFVITGVQLGLMAFTYPIMGLKVFKLVMFLPLIYLVCDLSENYIHYVVLTLMPMRHKLQSHMNDLLFISGWADLFKYIFFFSGIFFILIGIVSKFIGYIVGLFGGSSNKSKKPTNNKLKST